jgi:hypothetical protein
VGTYIYVYLRLSIFGHRKHATTAASAKPVNAAPLAPRVASYVFLSMDINFFSEAGDIYVAVFRAQSTVAIRDGPRGDGPREIEREGYKTAVAGARIGVRLSI